MSAIDWDSLIKVAAEALGNAYSPYSHFRVGSAVLMEDGSIFSGCNVENASYGATVCAERVAIGAAIAQGRRQLKAIAVVTESNDPWPPCGLCRQVILEFSNADTPVICTNPQGQPKKQFTVGELAPHSFSSKQLK